MTALAVRLYRGQQALPALDPADRGLAYGDGLFETMRVARGRLPWWPAHHARLQRGAAVLGFAPPPRDWLEAELAALLAQAPDGAVLKLVLTRGAGGRGYAAQGAGEPTLLLSLHPLPAPVDEPVVLRWCSLRMAIQPALAGLKHLNRLEQVLARAEWDDPGVHEGLLLDARGRVACATAANVFARIGGRWLTPRVDECGVAGVARAWVLANAGDAAEAELSPADLESAEALFLCNAVRGILPVGRLGERRWPPHAGLRALREAMGRELAAG